MNAAPTPHGLVRVEQEWLMSVSYPRRDASQAGTHPGRDSLGIDLTAASR